MKVQLTPMNQETFDHYYKNSVKEYANQHVQAGNWKEEDALQKAENQFTDLLPAGLETNNQKLFSIVHNEQNVGILWIHIRTNGQEKQAFIYDIHLDNNQQGKGLGKATMEALDAYAISYNIKQIGLHVFAHNHRAISLYKKMGYHMTGHHMAKRVDI